MLDPRSGYVELSTPGALVLTQKLQSGLIIF